MNLRGYQLNLKTMMLVLLLVPGLVQAAGSVTYPVAHVRQGDVSTVLIVISPNFFNSDGPSQAGWYKAVVSCVRGAKLAGDIFVVSGFNQRFNYYGPKTSRPFVEKLNMKWVNARVNRQLTCSY